MNQYLEAVLLGVLESLTEFLPISSTGHLILLSDILGFVSPGNLFQVVIQSGAVLALCLVYFIRLGRAVLALPYDPLARRFAATIVVAFVPAATLGALFHGFIKTVLFSPTVVGWSLLIGGVVILLVERWRPEPRHFEADRLPVSTALGIGLAQTLSLIPGVSRSGSTIMSGLLLGVDRRAAAEFSFFLSIPVMFGATAFDLYKNRDVFTADQAALIGVGFVTAFVAGLAVVKGLLAFVRLYSYRIFGWYRIVLGLIVLGLLAWAGRL